MSRGVCMTRAPVVRVRGGWGGTHLRYLAVKSAVRYWAITILPLDSSLTLMEWVGGGLQESVHRGMADLGGRPSTPAAPSVLRAAPQNHTRGGRLRVAEFAYSARIQSLTLLERRSDIRHRRAMHVPS